MKIAIAAEGETEIGDPDAGVAAAWIRRLLRATEDDAFEVKPLKLAGAEMRRERTRRGEDETAALAYLLARKAACDGLVLFRDTDGRATERRDLNRRGLAGAAGTAGSDSIPAVLGLQIEMVESWLLADPDAFLNAFGRPRPDLPGPPEELWGDRRDPSSAHPKQVYRRVLDQLDLPRGRHTAAALAEHADPDVVARACPEGFGRFKADFERAFRPFDCVVAADRANGIGAGNDLPWPRLKGDLRHFRETTTSAPDGTRNAVIMGRRTWESVPEKFRPLPGRLNIVVSRRGADVPDGVLVARSLDHALTRACLVPDIAQLFVVGGGQIYREAFAHVRCRHVYLTRIDFEFHCDTFIPDVTLRFDRTTEGDAHHDAGFDYRIERWTRRGAGEDPG